MELLISDLERTGVAESGKTTHLVSESNKEPAFGSANAHVLAAGEVEKRVVTRCAAAVISVLALHQFVSSRAGLLMQFEQAISIHWDSGSIV
jgi:hypothetical protein